MIGLPCTLQRLGLIAAELLGGFEQVDLARHRKAILDSASLLVQTLAQHALVRLPPSDCVPLLRDMQATWSALCSRGRFAADQKQARYHSNLRDSL